MLLGLILAAASQSAAPAPPAAACGASGACRARMSADELVRAAEKLVFAGQYEAAKPFIEALKAAPDKTFERRFLAGYVAVETAQYDEAVENFRAILEDDPKQTRVRQIGRAHV